MDLITLALAKAHADKNRIAYEETVQVPLDIQWDGVADGRDSFLEPATGMTFVKVSDLILSDDELKNCTLTVFSTDTGTQSVPITELPEENWSYCGESTNTALVAVVRNTSDNMCLDNFEEPVYAPSTGIYFVYFLDNEETVYDSRLYSDIVTMPQTVVHKIPGKYLPEGCPYEEIGEVPLDIRWDGVADGRDSITLEVDGLGTANYTKISDLVLSDEELKQCVIQCGGESLSVADFPDEYYLYFGESTNISHSLIVVRNTTDNLNPDPSGEPLYAPSTGIYSAYALDDGACIYIERLYSGTVTISGTVIHRVPKKYLAPPEFDLGVITFGSEGVALVGYTSADAVAEGYLDVTELVDAMKSGIVNLKFTIDNCDYSGVYMATKQIRNSNEEGYRDYYWIMTELYTVFGMEVAKLVIAAVQMKDTFIVQANLYDLSATLYIPSA